MKVIAAKNDYSGLVRKEREYIVLGMMIYEGYTTFSYLISYSGDWPDWISSDFFYVLDGDILPDWHMKMYNKNPLHGLFCLSGFNELCNNRNYYEALIEREKWTLDIYSKKYKDAVEWYEVKPFMTKKASLW